MKYCHNCGSKAGYRSIYPVDSDLIATWALNSSLARLFNAREGQICKTCGVNIRAQGLARAILESKFGFGATCLKDWVGAANRAGLSVCELNSCHELHRTLVGLTHLTYSEYGTESQQNIEALSYEDNSFDLVLHSETLEHVNDPFGAMNECRRVAKDDGIVLFTTPVIWDRKTRRRASSDDGAVTYTVAPSYHGKRTDDYLVFYEYGSDIDQYTGANVCYADAWHQNFVFCSGATPTTISASLRKSLRLKQKAVELTRVFA
jgi:SAM-dependent methyltransferase